MDGIDFLEKREGVVEESGDVLLGVLEQRGFSLRTLTQSAPCLQDGDSLCHVPTPSLPAL